MKKTLLIIPTVLLLAMVYYFYSSFLQKASSSLILEENRTDFKKYIKEKPYTILYFWASWCGIFQAGLLNDYAVNYKYLNNDTVQSLLIVASDTNAVNEFMVKNNIDVPYKCLEEGSYLPLIGNIMDGRNKEKFIKELFHYKGDIPGFPTVLLVDSSFHGLMESSKTTTALRLCHYFEKKKASN